MKKIVKRYASLFIVLISAFLVVFTFAVQLDLFTWSDLKFWEYKKNQEQDQTTALEIARKQSNLELPDTTKIIHYYDSLSFTGDFERNIILEVDSNEMSLLISEAQNEGFEDLPPGNLVNIFMDSQGQSHLSSDISGMTRYRPRCLTGNSGSGYDQVTLDTINNKIILSYLCF